MDPARIVPEFESIAGSTLCIKRARNDDSVIVGFCLEFLSGSNTAIRLQEKTAIFVHAQPQCVEYRSHPKA
jgi:hypothetical protein